MADLALVRELAEADSYLAVIAVSRADATVHASLVKAGILADPIGGAPSIGVVVGGDARKLAHLRQRRQATIVFRDGWRWVAVEGPVTLVGPDDLPEEGDADVAGIIRDVYQAAGGTHEDWDEFDRVMAEDRRCAVFVRAAGVRSNG
jgi:Pyridoxamine 5'-phosphate oxidase